jgi:O-antigen/teichoic acid export membrane protein
LDVALSTPQIIQGRQLARNSLLNLSTGLISLCLNLVFVPLMIRSFGIELFGVLTATWMVLANLGWLDLGFSKASASYVAQELAKGRREEAALWSWTALTTQTFLGLGGSVLLLLIAPILPDMLHVHPDRRDLVILTLRLFAFAIPLDFATRSISGVLQAGQRFDLINSLGLFGTLWTLGVYTVGIFRTDFRLVVYGLFALRALSLIGFWLAATRVLPSLKGFPPFGVLAREYSLRARRMMQFGLWVSVGGLVAPALMYFDQWLIGIVLGVAILPFYSVPIGLLSRLSIVPSSITSTLFPAVSSMKASGEWERIESFFVRSHRYVLVALVPPLLVLFIWASEILRLWIGPEFAREAATPLRVLVVGFTVSLLAPISGAFLDGIGKPDLVVKLYVIELPINCLLVFALASKFGIVGAAMSYAIRAIGETIALWFIVHKVANFSWLRFLKAGFLRTALILAPICVVASFIGEVTIQSKIAIVGTLVTLAVYAFCIPIFIFDRKDRVFWKSLLTRKHA